MPSARWPQETITSSTPWRTSQSITYAMWGRPASGSTGFGTV